MELCYQASSYPTVERETVPLLITGPLHHFPAVTAYVSVVGNMWQRGDRASGTFKWLAIKRSLEGGRTWHDQANAKPCNFCAAFSSKVRVAEQPLQIPSEQIIASSKVPIPFRSATTAW